MIQVGQVNTAKAERSPSKKLIFERPHMKIKNYTMDIFQAPLVSLLRMVSKTPLI